MSIFIDRQTSIIVQGITGKEGSFWTKHMKEMGSKVVAGVTPGKEGMEVEGIPVFHSVRNVVVKYKIDAAMLFVPPQFTYDAVMEAIDSGIKKIVTIADGIPLHEMLKIRSAAIATNTMVIGGNTSGVISPGKAMMGALPYWIERVYKKGNIGVMTRSGSLTNEITAMIVAAGFGVSTLIGVGGDPVPGARFCELLPLYENDPETHAVVLIGELGGTMEEEVAALMEQKIFTKPLVSYLSGRTAPKDRKMGHAGAIISGGKGSVEDKTAALEKAGALIAMRPGALGSVLQEALGKTSRKAE